MRLWSILLAPWWPRPRMTDACCWAPASSALPPNRLRGWSDGLKAERGNDAGPQPASQNGHVTPEDARKHYDAPRPSSSNVEDVRCDHFNSLCVSRIDGHNA